MLTLRWLSLFSLCICFHLVADFVVAADLGSAYNSDGTAITFRVYSSRASRLEVWIYNRPEGEDEKLRRELIQGADHVWSAKVTLADLHAAGVGDVVYYGLRAWGPNWPYKTDWTKGSDTGFVSDVDSQGNRFNPNKLLLDPYAREVSHDPRDRDHMDGFVYMSGDSNRSKDSGVVAAKGIVLNSTLVPAVNIGTKPVRPLRDDIIYEVHLRGLTANDSSVPAAERGTFAGAARKADYLKSLGVTAVEFLPLQEMQNDQNDVDPNSSDGDNYWGYDPMNYFSPDRRYAHDKSPGGPTKEFKSMVRAFHDNGLKVYIDVVYNHTGEGGLGNNPANAYMVSYRGLDNPTYYLLAADRRHYFGLDAVPGAALNVAKLTVRDLIVDSIKYWTNELGVDGFRFDLAPVLGNKIAEAGYEFDKMPGDNALNRLANELPVRPMNGGVGADLIAEPWGGSFQLGAFPSGWAEWNDHYRDAIRRTQNKLDIENVPPAELARRWAGSNDFFQDDGRKPWHSINFIVAHDGFTLRDLYSFNSKQNSQPYPKGPSDGGSDDNKSWDQGGNAPAQRQAARTGLALLMVSAGVPMITGGDEFYRTAHGNNNPYNLDSEANYLNPADAQTNDRFFKFSKKLFAFRRSHPSLRPAEFFKGSDSNSNGLKDITWLRDNAQEADTSYMQDSNKHFLAFRLDGSEFNDPTTSIYCAYNGWKDDVTATLPNNLPGKKWHRVADTAEWMEPSENFKDPGSEEVLTTANYVIHPRSAVILIER